VLDRLPGSGGVVGEEERCHKFFSRCEWSMSLPLLPQRMPAEANAHSAIRPEGIS